MKKGLQGAVSLFRREEAVCRLPALGQSGRTAAQFLRCESSEDGDGATGRRIIEKNTCRMHDPLQFAFRFGGDQEWPIV